MERGRGALYIYSDKDDQSILDFGEEENLAGIFGYCCEESLNHFLSPEILAWEYFFFRGGGGINFWSKDIYIYFFLLGGGGVIVRSPNNFFGGGVDFCVNLTISVPPPLPISLGAELILKISHLTRNTVRTLKKP